MRKTWLFAGLAISLSAQAPRAAFISYADARTVLAALADTLPAELRASDEAGRAAAWNEWVVRHDREVRDRLERGDEDSIVNWLLFGTAFTNRPRALLDPPPRTEPGNKASTIGASVDAGQLSELVAARTRDLAAALAAPGTDERRLFARQFLERKGYRFDTADDRGRVEERLLAEVARVAREQEGYGHELEAARQLGDAGQEFAARSRLFRTRGLSLDTSLLPGFALEQSLQQMRAQRLLMPGSVRRVAVVGPGLDFSDKSSGYDFYPQQTLQPFALVDSLVRLQLADSSPGVEVTTFDVSSRVNDHLRGAHDRANAGSPYVLRLPLDLGLPWKPGVLEYWKRTGDQIGVATRTTNPPAIGKNLQVRTTQVRPPIALRVIPQDLNIVVQRFSGPPFDLVVATNVLVYYDVLDQCLALANIEAMLRPGGFLLSNNALLELPTSRMRSVGYLTTQYSDRPDDGDHIVWYQRRPE
jgi:hypothetical protein